MTKIEKITLASVLIFVFSYLVTVTILVQVNTAPEKPREFVCPVPYSLQYCKENQTKLYIDKYPNGEAK